MSKTIFIGGRLESKEKGNVVAGANAILDDTKGKKQNVINKETDDELLRLEQSKQDNLTFDNAPTEDSTNPVTSGGVYTAEKALSDAIEAILLLIPSAATALNKLVDTNTMNSSISTATATFRGTYNAVSDLGLTYQATHAQIEAALDALGLTADNNDFAFVQIPVSDQSQDIAKTERFKFNGTNWLYEYDLNTSGFTAAQWAAINSTITLALVQKLAALPTNAELLQALGLKQDVLTFDNAPTTDSNNPVKSGGIKTAIDNAVGDEATARDNADTALAGLIGDEKTRAEGVEGGLNTRLGAVENSVTTIQGVIPSGATSSNKLVDNSSMTTYIGTIIDNIDATFNVTSTDGHVTLAITQVNGVITSVQLTTSDIASAAALNLKASQADLTAAEGNITSLTERMTTAEGHITSLTVRVSTSETDIANLQQLYNNLQQSKPEPVTALPSTGQQQGVIYRLAGTTYYSDYMWNGSSWVLMATYNNAIDDEPIEGSYNLAYSGGIAKKYGEYQPNGQFIMLSIDADKKLLYGVNSKGEFIFAKMPPQIKEELDKKLSASNEEISLQRSAFIPSNVDSGLYIAIPYGSNADNIVTVNTEQEFDTALTNFINGNSNVIIKLGSDILFSSGKSIESSAKELIIEGCGHIVGQKGNVYTPSGYEKGLAYSSYSDSLNYITINNRYIDVDKKTPLSLSRSRYYEAAGRVTDEDGNNLTSENRASAGTRRFKLPNELANLSIVENDDVWINLSMWFYAGNCKVTKTEDGYLYFYYGGGVNIDGDYTFSQGKRYTSFCLINHEFNNNGITIKNNKIYYPASCSSICDCGNSHTFYLKDNTGLVTFNNVNFIGSPQGNSYNVIYNIRSNVKVTNCSFKHISAYPLRAESYEQSDDPSVVPANIAKTYVINSAFNNILSGCVYSGNDTTVVFKDCKVKDVDICRNNDHILRLQGYYNVINNIIEDYGYAAIATGRDDAHVRQGIIEYNTIRQTEEYSKEADKRTVMDAGAIYVWSHSTKCIIRYNKIINYNGRWANRGIFMDDDADNVYVYGNIVENTPNSLSIEAYYANAGGVATSTNKYIAENVVDGSIYVSGAPDLSVNECYVGYNALVGLGNKSTQLGSVKDSEDQYIIPYVSISQGVLKYTNKDIDFSKWNL